MLQPLLELLEQLGVVLAGAVPVAITIAIDVGVDVAHRLAVGLLLLSLELLVRAQGDVEGLLVVAAHDRDLDRLANAVGAHGQDGAVGRGDLRAANAHDDVALLDAGLVGGAARGDLGHVGALAHGELVGLGVLGVDRLHGEADVGVGDLLAVHDLLRHVNGVVAWDGKANAGKALRIGGVERADAHELAAVVDQGAAGVTGVDGRIHLDEVGVERVARAGLHELVARQGRDDALRDGLLEAKRAAHGHDPIAHLQGGGVPHLDGRDGVSLEVRLDHGEVARAVRAHKLGVVALAVDGHGDGVGVLDDVVVGDDVALGVQHHAGAQALAGVIGAGDRDHGRQGLGSHRPCG